MESGAGAQEGGRAKPWAADGETGAVVEGMAGWGAGEA